MHRQTIINAHPAVFPLRHVPSFRFVSHRHKSNLYPSHYAVVSKVSGQVERIEYDSKMEYKAHLIRIRRAIKSLHKLSGIKRDGCDCGYCHGR